MRTSFVRDDLRKLNRKNQFDTCLEFEYPMNEVAVDEGLGSSSCLSNSRHVPKHYFLFAMLILQFENSRINGPSLNQRFNLYSSLIFGWVGFYQDRISLMIAFNFLAVEGDDG